MAQAATRLAVGVPGWEGALLVLAAYPQKGTALVAAIAVVPVGPQAQVVLCHDLVAALVWWLEARLVLELATAAAVATPEAVVEVVLLQAVH